MEQIPKEAQDKIAQFQGLQNQLQMISMQRQQLILQSADVDNALTELENVTGEKIYEAVGPLLIETNKESSGKKLRDNKEMVSTRIKILEKQEQKISNRLNELKTELQSLLRIGEERGVVTAG